MKTKPNTRPGIRLIIATNPVCAPTRNPSSPR